ncbi:hypothetical protein [Chitinilyticum piscinae]|uniref:Transcription factor zinc-finger domain-containing protein n=1 Tax=Chitinilyticum piscinae TaxID=2866724 RepID=A0A8J7FMK6_9NEIS|nr:hypothetical protein [Chitinilyticum piscinae]MBE9609271.1 hypothetical protein [Chitinilyticum piscinae]
MNCSGCGAPLALNQPLCPACGLHNAVDLLAIGEYRVLAERSRLQCPNGCGDLQLLQLGAGLDLAAGFCPQCKGLQFAPGAVQRAVDRVARQAREINRERICTILHQRVSQASGRYRSCPVCRLAMDRRAYSPNIALLIDECPRHGTWLDAGKFTVLVEWLEAGGAQQAQEQADNIQRLDQAIGHAPRQPRRRVAPLTVLRIVLAGAALKGLATGDFIPLVVLTLIIGLGWRWLR